MAMGQNKSRFPTQVLILLMILGVLSVSCRIRSGPQPVALRAKIVSLAEALVGLPYRYGGTEITGFDCSGFIVYVYHAFGIDVPRTARSQMKRLRKIPLNQARPGDILVFKLPGGWHSALYLGEKRFVHAPKTGDRVRYDTLAGDWLSRLRGVATVSGI